MAYITSSAAQTLLQEEGLEIPVSSTVKSELTGGNVTVTRDNWVERASDRIDAIPFRTDDPNTPRTAPPIYRRVWPSAGANPYSS